MARVTVRMLPGGETRTVEAERVSDLIRSLGLDDESYVILRDGKPLLPGDRLRDGETIVVVRVLSGG
ncbi:MAG: hypothetical protein F7C34_03335 [Desulfurococcales archaeon]|nr:hypothetical protein [Desulfurococcales archaeon]